MKILIKAIRPHRQKVLTEGGEEMRLQQWANKQAASALREAGGDASGEQFNQARDALMHSAVNNPNEHGLKFMGERVPFDGQELEESLSVPDVEGERAAIDSEFAPAHEEHEELHDAQEKATEGLDESEIDRSKPGAGLFNSEAEADLALRQEELEQAMKEGTVPNESQEDINADKKRMPNIFDEQGNLRDGIEPEEGKKEFDPEAGAEHLRRIMTSRQVPMRDAWSILKNDLFNLPRCKGCGQVVGSVNEEGYCTYEDGCQPKGFTKAWNPNTQTPNEDDPYTPYPPAEDPLSEGKKGIFDNIRWCKKCQAMYKPQSFGYDMGLCPDCERSGGTNMPPPYQGYYPPSGPTEPDWGKEAYK